MSKPLHVVTGAFGYSGRWIAHHLLKQDVHVRTLTNAVGRDDPFDGKVEVHGLDFNDMDRLVASLEGAEVLYNTYWVRYNKRQK
ncbi:MAG: SDR family oxidoreductase, partial [Candidatus Poseidonia sp.]|nr:SDR family oxidoreductase [Poseidonia sp.]